MADPQPDRLFAWALAAQAPDLPEPTGGQTITVNPDAGEFLVLRFKQPLAAQEIQRINDYWNRFVGKYPALREIPLIILDQDAEFQVVRVRSGLPE